MVRQTCSQLRLTRRSPGLTAVHLAPPVGELSAKLTERGAQLCLTTRSPGLTAVHLAPPVGELSAKLTERATGRRSLIKSASARTQRNQRFQRFHGTPRKARFQRNHDFTVPPENHEINDFNEITIPRPPNGITKATKPTKTTKCLFCGHFVFFVVYGETVISLQPLALDKKRAALYTDKE